MNRYLTLDNSEARPAHRYYGRVDSIDVIDNQGLEQLVQLDAVAADGFDAEPNRGVPFSDAMDRIPLGVLEFSTLNAPVQIKGYLLDIAQPGAWLEVTQAPHDSTAVEVDYYPGLFADGSTVASRIAPVDKNLAVQLSVSFSMNDIKDETEATIAGLLGRVPAADFIVVFDVGHGNHNALWRSGGGATLYFDLGGGVTANRHTFPKKPVTPCFTQQPPIVLSHWDWDHWSSVGRFGQALDLHWIVPRCDDLGVHHRALAWELHRRGHLHVWPKHMLEYAGRHLRVEKCTGVGRNDSGLAMSVHGSGDGNRKRSVLLTGDAAYDCIPEVQRKTRFGAVVASHHGAMVDSISEVRPSGRDDALIYSVGHGNGFCHPRLHAELDYLRAGWLPRDTYSTAQRIRNRPNAIAISLSNAPVKTGCKSCDPKLTC